MDIPQVTSESSSKQPKLLSRVKNCIRDKHYSLRTEEAYVYWIRWYIRFHGLRHPLEMGAAEVKAFLSYLTNERSVSVSTHKQALCALLFLYKQVLETDFPWLDDIYRPNRPPSTSYCVDRVGGDGRLGGNEGASCVDDKAALWHWHAIDGVHFVAGQGCRFRATRNHCS